MCVEDYYRTDQYALFLDSLRFSQTQVLETEQDVRSIPWAIIAAHNLVQMSCVVALDERDTTQSACLSDQKLKGGMTVREKTIELLNSGQFDSLPEPYLASPASLLKRVQDKNDLMAVEAFDLDDEVKWNLERLNEYRDMVIHFLPSSWSLELDGMSEIFRSAFEFALLTLRTPGTYSHRMEVQSRHDAEETCLRMIEKLNEGNSKCTAT
ncbi:hypothetical protein [Hyphomonas oceanitis]|uniref:Uncharacterized protein n=1 Tax=Hyphomonas oceanitis SCH89 TaxID=1280953 RepID=A0A059GAM5_9PROT|nr:hypothetical protein [Hyphomonas oceanitis]KDA03635.1 hypothetical protein HOC_04112 [Hyphomonas oceanitis SCH89]